MAIMLGSPGLIPNLLHRTGDGKLLLSEGGARLTRSVTPRFVALVADELVQTRWGDWATGTCSRTTDFAVAPVDTDKLVRFSGYDMEVGTYEMLREKASNSAIWKCFTSQSDADYPLEMRVEHMLPTLNICPFTIVCSTDQSVASELSDTEVVYLQPGYNGASVPAYYGVRIAGGAELPDDDDSFDEEWPSNIFASATVGDLGNRGLFDGLAMEWSDLQAIADEFVRRLESYAGSIEQMYFGDYRMFLGLKDAVAEEYVFTSKEDLETYADEAEALREVLVKTKEGTGYTDEQCSYYKTMLDIFDTIGCVSVGDELGVMWAVVKPDRANREGIHNTVQYDVEDVCDEDSPCRGVGYIGDHSPTCNQQRYSDAKTSTLDPLESYVTLPVNCMRYEWKEVDGVQRICRVEIVTTVIDARIASQLAPRCEGDDGKEVDQVEYWVDQDCRYLHTYLDTANAYLRDHPDYLPSKVPKTMTGRELKCSLLDRFENKEKFLVSGLMNGTFAEVPSELGTDLSDPPTCKRYVQGRAPLDYHTTRQLRATIGMSDPEPGEKPAFVDGERVPVTGSGEWFTQRLTGGTRRFDSIANQFDQHSGFPVGECLALTTEWSWDRFGDNLFLDRLTEEIGDPASEGEIT